MVDFDKLNRIRKLWDEKMKGAPFAREPGRRRRPGALEGRLVAEIAKEVGAARATVIATIFGRAE